MTGWGNKHRLAFLTAFGLVFSLGQAKAQAVADAGSILRDIQRNTPELSKPAEPAKPLAPPVEAPILKQGQTVLVKDLHIKATLFPEAILKDVVKDSLGREDSLGDLEEAAAKISRYYRDHGYLARAYLPRQTIHDGIVEIVVLESRLGAVSVDPSSVSRLSPDIAVGRLLAQQDLGDFIRPDAIADGIANLDSLPGVAATATLVPGQQEGQSDVVLKVQDTPLVSGLVMVDNSNQRAIGRWRAVGSTALNDALGLGDQETITLMRSATSEYGRLAAQAPVTEGGLTLGANVSSLQFSTAKEINSTEPSGLATTMGLSASYPLYRDEAAVFFGQASLDHKRVINQVSFITTADDIINVGALGVGGSLKDEVLGEGGMTTVGLTASFGRLDLGANDGNQQTDALSARSQGNYGKVVGNLERTQPLSDDTAAALGFSGQWSGKNLDSTEKFALGGPSGIRAYPVSEASGDKGWLGDAELRHTPMEDVQIALFADAGRITLHTDKWPGWQGLGTQPNSYYLYGTGLWGSWTPLPGIIVKATLAQALGENPGRSAAGYDNDGTRQRTRLWVQTEASF